MKIYFEGGDKAKTLLELFTLGYTELAYGGSIRFKKTYTDKSLQNQQCHIARRSLDDLLLIARTYFPKASLSEVLIALNEIKSDNYLYVFYCAATQRPVFVFVTMAALAGAEYAKLDNTYISKSLAYIDRHEQSDYSIRMIKSMYEHLLVTH